MGLTPTLALRAGEPCWQDAAPISADPLPDRVDIAIVGAGIMGSMLAMRLAQSGKSVAILDRRPPVTGSTAGSTALVLWAADTPLTHLAQRIGSEAASTAWRRLHQSVRYLDDLVTAYNLDCGWTKQPELYLEGNLLDAGALKQEVELRRAFGLPSEYLASAATAERFDLPKAAATLSAETFGVDPIALTLELQRVARAAGACFVYPADVVQLSQASDCASLILQGGQRFEAAHVILATGYEAARLYLPGVFSLASSFAIATTKDSAVAWREDAMIWQASDPYHYVRRTADGRLLVGGGDIDTADPSARDHLLPARRGELEAYGARLLGLDSLSAECAWASNFGTSPDGLPAIGRAANADRIWLAYGFGGNGITFAQLAAELLPDAIDGCPDADLSHFDPYRFDR